MRRMMKYDEIEKKRIVFNKPLKGENAFPEAINFVWTSSVLMHE